MRAISCSQKMTTQATNTTGFAHFSSADSSIDYRLENKLDHWREGTNRACFGPAILKEPSITKLKEGATTPYLECTGMLCKAWKPLACEEGRWDTSVISEHSWLSWWIGRMLEGDGIRWLKVAWGRDHCAKHIYQQLSTFFISQHTDLPVVFASCDVFASAFQALQPCF